MRKLSLYLKNKLLKSVDMTEDESISVGRQESCNMVIDENSISREHLVFSFEDGSWKVVCKSRFDCLEDDEGNTVKEVIIPESNYEINLNKYKLIVEASTSNESVMTESSIESELPLDEEKSLCEDENNEPVLESQEQHTKESCQEEELYQEEESKEEVTQELELDSFSIKPFITISIGEIKKTVELDGDKWIFGKTDNCDVKINSQYLNNQHFEVRKDNSKYYITDLNSSHGTNVNGVNLTPNREVELVSGSLIRVKFLNIQFELKDSNIEKQLVAIAPGSSDFMDEYSDGSGAGGAVRIPVQKPKQNKKVLIVASVIILIVVFYLMEGEEKSKTQDRSVAAVNQSQVTKTPFDILTDMQKQLVINSYALANKMYKDSKYNIALSEIQKIHDLIPGYKDSKMIENLSLSAIETLKQQEEIVKMEKEQNMLKQKVESILVRCEKLSEGSLNKSGVQSCLEEVASIDPDNARMQIILQKVDKNIADKKSQEASRNRRAVSIRMGENLYKKAKNLHSRNRLLDAIDAYNKHINSSYLDPKNLKAKSKVEISKIKSSIGNTIKANIRNANSSARTGNYKRAILNLRKNLYLDPNHQESREKITSYTAELRKKTRALFQDAILEENMGNLESAKGKWKQITTMDIPDGEYMKKAKIKLKKYGL